MVLSGFAGLSSREQDEFITLLNRYVQSNDTQRAILRKDFTANRVSLGPTGASCVCCGR